MIRRDLEGFDKQQKTEFQTRVSITRRQKPNCLRYFCCFLNQYRYLPIAKPDPGFPEIFFLESAPAPENPIFYTFFEVLIICLK